MSDMEPIRAEDFQAPLGPNNLAELFAYRERMLKHLSAALADLERLHAQQHQQLGDPAWEGARARAESRLAVSLELTSGVDRLIEVTVREQERAERNASAHNQASINRGLRQATWVMAGFTVVLAVLQLVTLGAQLWIVLHHLHP